MVDKIKNEIFKKSNIKVGALPSKDVSCLPSCQKKGACLSFYQGDKMIYQNNAWRDETGMKLSPTGEPLKPVKPIKKGSIYQGASHEKATVAGFDVDIVSVPMTEEEKRSWKKLEDICPVCQEPFGTLKQVRVGKLFKCREKDAQIGSKAIIHKKCAVFR